MTAMLGAVDPQQARNDVQSILDGYRPNRTPRPLQGFLDWLGDRVGPIEHFVGRFWSNIPHALRWPIGIAATAGLAALVVWMFRRRARRSADAERATRSSAAEREATARELEAQADAAAAAGDHALAVRLRFRAGLVRLDDDAHAIDLTPALLNSTVRSTLDDTRFDGLATTFEEITYGERPAVADESERARSDWPVVVREARR